MSQLAGEALSTANEDVVKRSEMQFIDFLLIMAKRKKLIVGLPIAAAVLSAAVSFVIPNIYKATTKILPPQQAQSGAAALLSQLGGAAGAAAGVAGVKNPNDLYIGMLKSRTVADRIISQYGLKEVYDEKDLDKTRKELEENTVISSGKDNLITIEFEDKDKKRATQIANSYTAELLRLTKLLAVTEASQRRVFFERELEKAKNNLANTEIKLKGNLDAFGVISVDSDSRAIVETVGRLRAQIAAKQIQINSMQSFVTSNSQEYKRAQQDLISLRAELDKLQNGSNSSDIVAESTSKKKGGLENIKLLRDVKYHQMIYELLSKQYEVARLDESKDASIIQVLDPAIEPERKFKPKRGLIVALSTVLAFLAAIGIAYFLDFKERMLVDPLNEEKWKKLIVLLRKRKI